MGIMIEVKFAGISYKGRPTRLSAIGWDFSDAIINFCSHRQQALTFRLVLQSCGETLPFGLALIHSSTQWHPSVDHWWMHFHRRCPAARCCGYSIAHRIYFLPLLEVVSVFLICSESVTWRRYCLDRNNRRPPAVFVIVPRQFFHPVFYYQSKNKAYFDRTGRMPKIELCFGAQMGIASWTLN